MFAARVYQRIRSLPVALSIVSFLWSTVYLFEWRQNAYEIFHPTNRLALRLSGAEDAALFLLLVSCFVFCRLAWVRVVASALVVCSFINALIIWVGFFEGYEAYWRIGFMANNGSMDACLIATLFPFLSYRRHNWKTPWPLAWLMVPVGAILLTQSSMGIATLAVAVSAMLVAEWYQGMSHRQMYAPPVIGGFLAICSALFYVSWNEWVDTTARSLIWKASMRFWEANANHWFGMGQGTATVLLPIIQKGEGVPFYHGVFVWMHSDFLQLLFEQGVVGLSLGILAALHALWRSFKSPHVFGAVAAFVFSCVANLPAHWPITALVGLTVVTLAFREKETVEY